MSPKESKDESPFAKASFFSRLLFIWYDSMAYKGYRKALTQSDMWPMIEDHQTASIVKKTDRYFEPILSSSNEPAKTKPVLKVNTFKVLIKVYWPILLFGSVCKLISSSLVFANPQLLDALLTFIVSNQPIWKGYVIASLMFATSLFQSLLDSQCEFWTQVASMKMKSALTATIYRKSLRLSSLGRRNNTTGEVVNLMAVDIQRIIAYINIASLMLSSPIQLVITIYLLWRQLGVSSFAGLGAMLIFIPFNGFFTTRFKKCQSQIMKEKDARSKMISEILNGMKVLKLYAWEGAFGEIVASIRRKEIKILRFQSIWLALIFFALGCGPFLIAVVSFATYVLIDKNHILNANKTFVSISLINILNGPLAMLPIVIAFGANFLIAIRRINNYLEGDELDANAVLHKPDPINAINIEEASFSWSPEEEPVLKDIDMKFERNKLVAIVGTVGSGKSSLISAILGDLYKSKGLINVDGKIAYVPQSAWIMNSTVRRNILLENPFVRDKYNPVIDACALDPDFKLLSGGDATEIGERGINISGGQKQRISIARAVYSDSDIFLLDDPLSAVDAHVAKHLFDNVIGPEGLLKNKTRLLVTHRITFLTQVDQIIVMKDGKIYESGTYSDLMAKKGEFADFIAQYSKEENNEEEKIDQISSKELNIARQVSVTRSDSMHSQSDTTSVAFTRTISTNGLERSDTQTTFKLTESESVETGSVKLKVYLKYFKAIGVMSCLVTILLFMATSGFNLGTSLWLTSWSDDSLDPNKMNDTALRNKRLSVYAGLGFSGAFCTLINTIIMNFATIAGARWIYEKMLSRLIQAPMSWFDTTPLGRIINRFTKDIDTADTLIYYNLNVLMNQFFRAILSIVIICLETPFLIIFIFVLGFIYIIVQKFYIASSRQLRRIEAVTGSPIFSHFSETISGSTSIRAYGVEQNFIDEMNKRVDTNNGAYFPNLAANRWLAIRLELLGNIIVTLTAIFAVVNRGKSSPGATGLSISYALQITTILNMLIRAVSDIETNIVSIERCLEYTKMPIEAPWVIPEHRPYESWPEKGQIVFRNYSARYRPGLDLVLKDIVCVIKSNEKVGIVGRTGAGKSSLTLALFRLIEPTVGTIIIDGENITKMGLHDLRSRLTVIPQDPVLFSGSFRRNFDPFDIYTDAEIWKALDQAHLKVFVSKLDKGLDHEITEGGENLSIGQRQLVCLTRALLRKTKILVLDEATAAVDVETDELIQQTIRKEFADCTIVTIAHRFNTILDYDKIIVMDKGQIIEYDSPQSLLHNDRSVFYSMAKDSKLI
nr:ABC transporter subfamily C1 [Tetranychus urticae]